MTLIKDRFIVTELSEDRNVEKATELLYDTYWEKLHAFALGYVKSPQDADDVAQESMIRFLHKVQKSGFDLEREGRLKTYLLTIGRNCSFEFLRKKKQAAEAAEAFSEKEVPAPEYEITTEADRESSAWRTFSRLGAACQQLIRLFLEGKKSPEVREILGISTEENVRAQKKRCLQKLAKLQQS